MPKFSVVHTKTFHDLTANPPVPAAVEFARERIIHFANTASTEGLAALIVAAAEIADGLDDFLTRRAECN